MRKTLSILVVLIVFRLCPGFSLTDCQVKCEANAGTILLKCNSGEFGIFAELMTSRDAKVVCRECGYRGVQNFSQYDRFTPLNISLTSGWECAGNEPNISSCARTKESITLAESMYQRPEYAAGVACKIQNQTFDLQLAGGNNSSEGRVELFQDGFWGTIQGNSWGQNESDVTCRSLGFGRAIRYGTSSQQYGYGTGQIGFRNIKCIGNETSLQQCKLDRFIRWRFYPGGRKPRFSGVPWVECALLPASPATTPTKRRATSTTGNPGFWRSPGGIAVIAILTVLGAVVAICILRCLVCAGRASTGEDRGYGSKRAVRFPNLSYGFDYPDKPAQKPSKAALYASYL